MEMVLWFSSTFGGLPTENHSSFKRRIDSIVPGLAKSTKADPPPSAPNNGSSIPPPTSRVQLPLARLLLNHAVATHKRFTANSSSLKDHAAEVRAWWSPLAERLQQTDPEGWKARETVELLRKARRTALLETPVGPLQRAPVPSRCQRAKARKAAIGMGAKEQASVLVANWR